MNTKPLCLSHLEIDRWKLFWYISFFVNISFYFSAYFLLAWIFILYFPLPTPITFLMVHLTLRAEPPNLSSDAKWSSERMNNSAAERVHGQSLSFIQWRIQGKDPGGAGHPLFLDQTETRKAEKFFLETGSPLPHLRVWRTWTPPPLLSQGLDLELLCTYQCKPRGRGGGGGSAGKGWGFDKFQNFLIKFPRVGNERSIKSVKKDPTPGEKSKQTIL